MKNLIRLPQKERNAVVEALKWYSMAAKSDADLFNFATEEIDSKRNDPVTPAQDRSEPPLPVQTPVLPPMGPPSPEVGFNKYQLSLTPESAPPPGSTPTDEHRGVPKESPPAPIKDAAGRSPITGTAPVTGLKTKKEVDPAAGPDKDCPKNDPSK